MAIVAITRSPRPTTATCLSFVARAPITRSTSGSSPTRWYRKKTSRKWPAEDLPLSPLELERLVHAAQKAREHGITLFTSGEHHAGAAGLSFAGNLYRAAGADDAAFHYRYPIGGLLQQAASEGDYFIRAIVVAGEVGQWPSRELPRSAIRLRVEQLQSPNGSGTDPAHPDGRRGRLSADDLRGGATSRLQHRRLHARRRRRLPGKIAPVPGLYSCIAVAVNRVAAISSTGGA